MSLLVDRERYRLRYRFPILDFRSSLKINARLKQIKICRQKNGQHLTFSLKSNADTNSADTDIF